MLASSQTHLGRILVGVVAAWTFVPNASAQSAFVASRLATAPKPAVGTVALVLSAGAQFGWAHLGAIRWLEEHHVPVHCVVGTSMGALLGGLYASGTSPREIEDLAGSVDWTTALQSTPSYSRLSVRRKGDRRDVPGLLELGSGGLYGLSSIPEIALLLSRAALPYDENVEFDRLTLPYRAVSFDYVGQRPYVPAGGSLPLAIRGSISIPLAFTPAVTADRALGDGGVLRVLPVTTAVETFHPDSIIAVNTQPDVDLSQPEADTTPVHHPEGGRVPKAVRSMNVVGQGNAVLLAVAAAQLREQKRLVASLGERGVWVQPDVPRNPKPWSEWRFYEDRGYAAMEALADRLRPFELNAADWGRYVAWREAMRPLRRFTPQAIDVVAAEGGRKAPAEAAIARSLRPEIGKTLDATDLAHPNAPLQRLEGVLLDAQATGRFDSLDYGASPNGRTLSVYATPRAGLPTLGRFAPEFRGSETLRTLTTVRGRLTRLDPLGYGSEGRLDLALGTQNALGLELDGPPVGGGFFGAFRLYGNQSPLDVYAGDRRVGDARTEGFGAGIDLGWIPDRRTELRAGIDFGHTRLARTSGRDDLPDGSGPQTFLSLRGTYDAQDRAMVPTRGVRVDGALRDRITDPWDEGFEVEGYASLFAPFGNGSAFAFGGGGTAFGRMASPGSFGLVTPLRLSPLNLDTSLAGTYALSGAGCMLQLGRLPEIVGSGNVRLGLWGEWDEAQALLGGLRGGWSLNVGGFVESPLGPVYLGFTNDFDRRLRLRLLLGRLF